MPRGLKDLLLQMKLALPNGATNVSSKGIDLRKSSTGDFTGRCDFRIEAPALTTGQLANGATVTYDVLHADTVDANGVMQSPATLYAGALVQTGAGGAGAALASKNVALPSDVKRYVGFKATNSGAGNASTSTAVGSLVF